MRRVLAVFGLGLDAVLVEALQATEHLIGLFTGCEPRLQPATKTTFWMPPG